MIQNDLDGSDERVLATRGDTANERADAIEMLVAQSAEQGLWFGTTLAFWYMEARDDDPFLG